MNIRKPKSASSPNYLPPAPSGDDILPPTCGETAPFDPPWLCTREKGHEESSPEGKRDHAAHQDLAGLVAGEAGEYDRSRPLMVARWGSD